MTAPYPALTSRRCVALHSASRYLQTSSLWGSLGIVYSDSHGPCKGTKRINPARRASQECWRWWSISSLGILAAPLLSPHRQGFTGENASCVPSPNSSFLARSLASRRGPRDPQQPPRFLCRTRLGDLYAAMIVSSLFLCAPDRARHLLAFGSLSAAHSNSASASVVFKLPRGEATHDGKIRERIARVVETSYPPLGKGGSTQCYVELARQHLPNGASLLTLQGITCSPSVFSAWRPAAGCRDVTRVGTPARRAYLRGRLIDGWIASRLSFRAQSNFLPRDLIGSCL